MKRFLLFASLAALAVVYSCQKDTLPSDLTDGISASVSERGDTLPHSCDSTHNDSLGHHHHHPFDSLHVHNDSLHIHHDSLHIHNDSLHIHDDSLHTHHQPDSTGNGGPHPGGPHGGGNNGGGHQGGGHGGHH